MTKVVKWQEGKGIDTKASGTNEFHLLVMFVFHAKKIEI
jgi:hypothetical protein